MMNRRSIGTRPAAGICLVIALIGGCSLVDRRCADGTPLEAPTKLTHANLVKVLKQNVVLNWHQVFDLLTRIEDKDTRIAELGQFSVGQLLELNSIHNIDYCTSDELERRKQICEDLEEISSASLFIYCTNCKFTLETWCSMHGQAIFEALFKGLSERNKETIAEFANEVRQLSLADSERSVNEIVISLLGTKENWYKMVLEATCTILAHEMSKRAMFLNGHLINENFMLKSCEVIMLLAPKQINEPDEKGRERE
jgi:hypothetical protein